MDPKKIIEHADKALDPIGVLALVVVYFLNKYTAINLSIDEFLLISIGAGAFRSVWEGYKRKKGIHGQAGKREGYAQEGQVAQRADDSQSA